MATSRRKSVPVPWNRAEPGPLVLVAGPEALLADRAVTSLIRQARGTYPDLEVSTVDASEATEGTLAEAASGSLFADHIVVRVASVDKMTDQFLADALSYVAAPNPDAMVIFVHKGGNRGKKLLDTLRAAGAVEVAVPAMKKDTDKEAFAATEFRNAERKADADAIHALVQAVGTDLGELASACAQLAQDTVGRISRDMVDRYYGGRVETTGFKVADAAIAGDVGQALALARHALDAGMPPLLIVSALASKLRTMAKVGGAARAGKDPVTDLGIPKWQADRAEREVRSWDGPRLGRAILAVAQADSEVKGVEGSGDKVARPYAAERAIVAVAAAARGISLDDPPAR
jgi:DNA polymerase-3 subunit delta